MHISRLIHWFIGLKSRLFPLFLPFLLFACGMLPTPAPTPAPEPANTAIPTEVVPSSQLGTPQNPLILALAPNTHPSQDALEAGKTLAGLIEKGTGYTVVPVVPPTETDLVAGFGNGNAHIGVLSPFAYLLASNQGFAEATFAREHGNAIFYGAQYIARTDAGFKIYYDPLKNGNLADAAEALAQFDQKKPCWTDERSPSGYVVPLGILQEANIRTRDPAFLAGHVAVVRAIDVSGICDFGATYIDARNYPGLQDKSPNLLKKVDVIWRIPPIIPYETLVFVHGLDEGIRRNLTRAFVDLAATPEGKSAMQILYGFDGMQIVQDSQYDEFRKAVKASGLDLNELIKP